MRHLLSKFLHLDAGRRYLLVTTLITLVAIRLGLKLLRFHRLHQFLIRIAPLAQNAPAPTWESARQVVWAIDVVSRYMQPPPKCLARALSTLFLLRLQGYQTQLRIGVAKNLEGKLEAHAWLESQGKIIIGMLNNLSRYTPLPALDIEQ